MPTTSTIRRKEEGVAVNRRDLKKAAPFFGVLLIVATVLYVVGRFLL